jgi:DNA mismatch endonuclease (patch repair protein)
VKHRGTLFRRHLCWSNREYWENRILQNRRRDKRKEWELIETGMRVMTIWECELTDLRRLARELAGFLEEDS